MSYVDFSSWPRDQEQTFVVYEQHAVESERKAMIGGVIAAIAAFVVVVAIYAGVEPDRRDISKDMNMSNLTKKESKKTVDAPKADAPKAEAPAAEAPATK